MDREKSIPGEDLHISVADCKEMLTEEYGEIVIRRNEGGWMGGTKAKTLSGHEVDVANQEPIAHIPGILKRIGLNLVSNRSWVAEISGFDNRFGYKRKFLRPKHDYSKSNSRGSRGVYANYFPEHHKIYEVSAPKSWKSIDRYFCVFDNGGEHRLTEEEVRECLISDL